MSACSTCACATPPHQPPARTRISSAPSPSPCPPVKGKGLRAPEPELRPSRSARASGADPLWYNVPSNYRQSTERAFRVQEDTFRALGEADTWALETESSQQISERQLKVASSLAFAGDAANAIAVLRLALARVPLSAEQRERVSTAIAAHANGALLERSGDAWRLHVIAMLLDGTEGNELREPWPVVAVSVVESCADDATKRATADAIAALLAPPANKPGRFARKQRVLVLQKRIIDQVRSVIRLPPVGSQHHPIATRRVTASPDCHPSGHNIFRLPPVATTSPPSFPLCTIEPGARPPLSRVVDVCARMARRTRCMWRRHGTRPRSPTTCRASRTRSASAWVAAC